MAAAALVAPAADSQPPAAAACTALESGALDFWIGDWELSFANADGSQGSAVNRISRDEYGACVVSEHFQQADGDYRGASWSVYDPAAGNWKQTWVDNRGAYLTLVGGPVSGRGHLFELRTLWPDGKGRTHYRMIWERTDADNLVWRWQKDDGAGGFLDSWVIRYKRRR